VRKQSIIMYSDTLSALDILSFQLLYERNYLYIDIFIFLIRLVSEYSNIIDGNEKADNSETWNSQRTLIEKLYICQPKK